jgi:hypothetical protein
VRRRDLRAVTSTSNVIGHRPLDIVYLRPFGNRARARTWLEGAWREFGYVHLLRSADSVSPGELADARRRGGVQTLFVHDRQELSAHWAAVHRQGADARRRKRISAVAQGPVRVRDPYGSYPVDAVLCHGSFWKEAVGALLERADLVVLDLSGLSLRNEGTLHEVTTIVNDFPIECVVFLADPNSGRRFLQFQLHSAWSRMALGSPNANGAQRGALVAVTDVYVRTSTTNERGETTSSQARLVARRSQTRRLAALAQGRRESLGYD